MVFEDSDIPCLVILHIKKKSVTMDRYTRYYVNQSGGGGEIGPVYMASFKLQRGNGLGSFFRGLFRFVKPLLYSGAKAVENEALKTGSHIITDFLSKEPEQPVGDIFKIRFGEAKNNSKKIKNMTGSGLGLKRKRKLKKAQSQSKRRKVKDIFSEKKGRRNNGVFKVGA